MSFGRYPAYKRSSAQWQGDIPAHWKLLSLGRITRSRCDGPFGSALKSEHYTEAGARVIRLQNIRSGKFDGGDAVYVDVQYYETELMGHDVVAGDLLIAGLGDENHPVGRACVAPAKLGPALVKADCFRFRLESLVAFPPFIALQLCAGAESDAGRLTTGTTRARIPLSDMASRCIALPPFEEQSIIAAFVEREIGKIDSFVAVQEKVITLLHEKCQGLTSHAVSKGLNSGAPMKSSGVAWLGAVPAHWIVMPIRFAAKLESGHTPSRSNPEYWRNCNVPWFSLSDVWQIREAKADYVLDTKEKISEMGLANSAARVLPKGTVILSRTASVGYAAIMGVDMATTQDFANWVCSAKLVPEYLLYTLRSMSNEFARVMMGSTHNTIYMPDIQSLKFALPPLAEQREIVRKIRMSRESINVLIEEAERAITLLKERRTALIVAAVTGKIDVRGYAAKAPTPSVAPRSRPSVALSTP
jgi:type I restriction enzyme, S subunit